MTKLSIFHDPVLSRDALTITKIICFASGEPDWPPTDEFWSGIQADLKDACERGELPYSKNPSDPRRRLYYIRLSDLWRFLVNRDQRWQPLRVFCRQWAQARGDTLSPEQADGLADPLSPLPNLTDETRSDGGSKRKYNADLQKFIDQLFAKLKGEGTRLTPTNLVTWLTQHAPKDDGYETGIPDCDDVEFYDKKVWWKDRRGNLNSASLKTVERYIARAKTSASDQAA